MSTDNEAKTVREPQEVTLDWILNTPAMDLYTSKPPFKPEPGERDWRVPAIKCADGTTLSVQASATHYCYPRENGPYWSKVEVGYPSVEPPETWREYMDSDWENNSRTETVYGYVPLELVREYIEAHGGESALRKANPAAFEAPGHE